MENGRQSNYVIAQWMSRFNPALATDTAKKINRGFTQNRVRKGVWIDPPVVSDRIDVRSTLPSPTNPVRAVQIAPQTGGGSTTSAPPTIVTEYLEKMPVFTVTGTGPWTISVQVEDTDGNILTGRHWIRFTFGATEWASDNTTASITVDAATTYTWPADAILDLVTSSDGTCVLTISDTAEVWLSAAVGLERLYSQKLTYSAPASHPVGIITRLAPLGLPGRRCGSFAGR